MEWLSGSFAALNSDLKRDARPALDQAACYDFNEFAPESVHPARGAIHRQCYLETSVHTENLYNKKKSALMLARYYHL